MLKQRHGLNRPLGLGSKKAHGAGRPAKVYATLQNGGAPQVSPPARLEILRYAG
jgi:hypothetical protein